MGYRKRSVWRGCGLLFVSCWALVPGAAVAGDCGSGSPAFPVQEFRQGVRVWPSSFAPARPGQRLPADRDSTDYDSFGSYPTFRFGHELFQALDIVEDRLYMAYGAGLQIWDIGPGHEEQPRRKDVADGEQDGVWFDWGNFMEEDTWIYSVDALRDPTSADDLIVVGADIPVGVSLWLNRPTTGMDHLEQAYQDNGIHTRMSRTGRHNGRVYAFAASHTSDGGLAVYDISKARELAPCFDDASLPGRQCEGVYRGLLGDLQRFTRYVDVYEKHGKLWVAVADGTEPVNGSRPLQLEIWEVADPAEPELAVRRYEGGDLGPSDIRDIRSPVFFEWRARTYLAMVRGFVVEIYEVDHCLDADGCASLGLPQVSLPVTSWPGEPQLLRFSLSGSTPFLYYSMLSDRLFGSQREFLWNLSSLGGSNDIPEITDSGGSYVDPCNGLRIDYWGDYYQRNHHGLLNVVPNDGMFRGRHFYRAARGIFDVHVLAKEPGPPTYTTTTLSPAPFWFDEPITFEAVADACPTARQGWQWSASDTATSGGLGAGDAVREVTWTLCGTADCPDKQVEVWALNDDPMCSGDPELIEHRTTVEIRDRRPRIRSLVFSPVADPPGTYPVGTEISADAVIDGKAPFTYSWTIVDSQQKPVATGTDLPLVWDTSTLEIELPAEIFADGFESGDLGAWLTPRPAGEVFTLELTVANSALESDIAGAELLLTQSTAANRATR